MENSINISTVNPLFTLFSGESDVETYQPIIQNAIDDVVRRLKSAEYITDTRVRYLCAALANLRYKKFKIANDRYLYTFAGKTPNQDTGKQQYDFAESLFKEYVAASYEILVDNDFYFTDI